MTGLSNRSRKRVACEVVSYNLNLLLSGAQEARQDVEKRLRLAEGERDVYRDMARTWQSRIEHVLGEALTSTSASGDSVLEGAMAVMQHDSDNESNNEEEEEEEEVEIEEDDGTEDMEEEIETEVEEADDTTESMSISPPTVSEIVVRSQVRTVSISSSAGL